jgi:hypothetical protein
VSAKNRSTSSRGALTGSLGNTETAVGTVTGLGSPGGRSTYGPKDEPIVFVTQ